MMKTSKDKGESIMKMNRAYLKNTICLLLCLATVFSITGCKEKFNILKHLDETVVTVDTNDLLMSDMMYYIMVMENTVEGQALIYNSSDPKSYWNIHVNGVFMSVYAKEQVLNQAVYEEIMYNLALKDNISLTAADLKTISSTAGDKYDDMTNYQRKATNLNYDNIVNAVTKSAMVDKYNQHLIDSGVISDSDSGIDGNYYLGLKDSHNIETNDALWEKVNLGDITIKR